KRYLFVFLIFLGSCALCDPVRGHEKVQRVEAQTFKFQPPLQISGPGPSPGYLIDVIGSVRLPDGGSVSKLLLSRVLMDKITDVEEKGGRYQLITLRLTPDQAQKLVAVQGAGML